MSDRPPSTPPASLFARLWRIAIPLGVAIMATALLLGVFDTSARSAWLFVLGAVVGLLGLASGASRLFDLGRGEVRELEQRLERTLDERRSDRP